jgi:hypothetical protein
MTALRSVKNMNIPTFEYEVIEAYETRTGFYGLGDFLEKKRAITILRSEGMPHAE